MEKQSEISAELLAFFKALADANRLKIVGLLAGADQSVEQLAELLDLSASTVSHHLARLREAGLVSAHAEGYYSIYHFEAHALEEMAKRLLSQETLPAVAADVDLDAYDRKVLNTFLAPDGSIASFPTQQKKLEAILRYIIQRFERGVEYTEKEVNTILGELTDDISGLRRDLIDFGYMQRSGGGKAYWLVEKK